MSNTINVWDGTEWKTLATALPVPETTSVAISSNLTMVAGSPTNISGGGENGGSGIVIVRYAKSSVGG